MEKKKKNKKREEKGSGFYNEKYISHKKKSVDYKNYPISGTYAYVIKNWISENSDIIEFGCGAGQFVQMLSELKPGVCYKGFDFSEIAIKKAKEKAPKYDIFIGNIYDIIENIEKYKFNIIVAFEVLEHIQDLKILNKIRPYKKYTIVIASVPREDSEAHLRYFTTGEDVINHYKDVIDISDIKLIRNRFLFKGVLK